MAEIQPDAWYWPLTDRIFVRNSDTDIERKWLDVVDPHSFPHQAGLKEQEDYDQIEPLYSAETIEEAIDKRIDELEEEIEQVDNEVNHLTDAPIRLEELRDMREVFCE